MGNKEDRLAPDAAKITSIPLDKKPKQASYPSSNMFDIFQRPGSRHPFTVASNAGVLDFVCWINRPENVPFTKGNWVNDAIVFNSSTVASYPSNMKEMVDTVPGTEGLFLRPLYPYRHVFIEGSGDSGEVSPGRAAFIIGDPVYKKDQSFTIVESFFNHNPKMPDKYFARFLPEEVGETTEGEESRECDTSPIWSYQKVNKNATNGHIVTLSDTPESYVLMPSQMSSSSCNGAGIHWGLEKSTSMFKGEDFFIEFHKRALATDIPAVVRNSIGDDIDDRLEAKDEYAMLDTMTTKKYTVQKEGSDGKMQDFSISSAVALGAIDDETGDIINKGVYNFRTQAYYLIEIGYNDPEHNYVVIIAQNGTVRLVRRVKSSVSSENGDNDSEKFSELVSEYLGNATYNNDTQSGNKLTGNNLIESDWFRMTVRNHLGLFIIQFEGPGFQAAPWIINRREPANDEIKQESSFQGVPLYVAPEKIRIFGGNMQSGFLFGPLQYSAGDSGEARLTLPPNPSKYRKKRASAVAGVELVAKQNSDDRYQLPQVPRGKIRHKLLLTSTDHEIEGSGGNFFTQDAQRYSEHNGNFNREGTFFGGAGLKEESDAGYSKIEVRKLHNIFDEDNRVDLFFVDIKLTAGSHKFESGWALHSCKTPVLTMIRLVAEPDNSARWEPDGFECGHHVMQFSEGWTAQDFTKIEHTGKVRFLLHDDIPWNQNDKTQQLKSLRDKSFYIEIWAGYKTKNGSVCNYSKLPDLFKLFTGICYGGNITYEYGKIVMDCQIFDYSKILQDQMFFNSPFFDGVKDTFAVEEVLRFAGFRASEQFHPRFLIKKAKDGENGSYLKIPGLDGRVAIIRAYALPGAYSRIQQPMFKFKNGEKLYDAIIKFAERSGKVFFFDSYGVAHYENYRDIVTDTLSGGELARSSGCESLESFDRPMFWFTTSHHVWPGQLIFNSVNVMHDVQSVYNHRKIMTVTAPGVDPEGQSIVILDDVDYDTIENPDSAGFLGYMRNLYQQDGSFGSFTSAHAIHSFYKTMGKPPFVAKFETYGLPVRALDVISLNGQRLRVMRVESTIDPAKNVWWQSYECEWLRPAYIEVNSVEGFTEENNPASGNC